MITSTIAFEEALDKLREGGAGDLLRGMLQMFVQHLVELEAEQRIGAAPHERTPERQAMRNGVRKRELDTRLGKLDLRIPKLRQGSFFPSLLEPRRLTEEALLSVIQEAWINGMSTRSVDNLVQALGGDGIDKSKVSRICKELSRTVRDFQNRPLESEYLYAWLDATYIKVREGGRVKNKALVIAIALNVKGEREVVGFTVGHSESYESWLEFLRSLVSRGLNSPLLVISDAHEGLKRAIHEVFGGSSWQRCRVHFMRNVLSQVPKTQQPVVSAAVKQIYLQPDQDSARMVAEVASKLDKQLPKVSEKLLNEAQETLSFMAFPQEHWKQIHSTNGLERLNREIKRRADVVGIFPNDESSLRLLGCILQEQNDEWLVCRKVYSQESIAKALALRTHEEVEDAPANQLVPLAR